MIEPQNTMMPLPAEPAPVEVPQGDAGFGEMLAQTLGMIPQLDANAIQPVEDQAGQPGEGDNPQGEQSDQTPILKAPARLSRYISLPANGDIAVSKAVPVDRPPVFDGSVVDPTYDKGQPGEAPLPATPTVVPAPDTIPEPPAATALPIEDGIGEPVLTTQPTVAADVLPDSAPVLPTTEPGPATGPVAGNSPEAAPLPAPVAPDPRPEPPPAAPISPPIATDPVLTPRQPTPIDPVAVGPAVLDPVRPLKTVPGPVAPAKDRGLPTQPIPTADLPAPDATPIPVAGTVSVPTDSAPTARPDTAVRVGRPAVELAPEKPVNVDESSLTFETPRAAVQSAPAQGSPAPVVVMDATPQPTAPVTPASTPAAPTQHSALAERVLQAVELQANQPPPRTMVVDIPEIEGLRLVVSVRGGAEVHVVPATASTASNGVQPFLDELQGVLENRGFLMTGEDRRRGHNPQQDDEPAPRRPARPSFRQAEPTDNDLRI